MGAKGCSRKGSGLCQLSKRCSPGLNRAIVQHLLQQAGLEGHSVHAVSGLPVDSFYLKDGSRREETLARKRLSLKQGVQPIDGRPCLFGKAA